jgi:catechol 2,3-dioxygenase-like lactoylglutathione lyase family enzyme
MLDHISIGVSDLARSIAFYDAVGGALGFVRVWSAADAAGYGRRGGDDTLAIKQEPAQNVRPSARSHIAFAAPNRDAARAFHAAALAHGGADDGAPGLCPEYGPGYFAAFVRDPDGYRLEAVLHE